ncbi:uncharacterized protein LOC129316901 [Prosopis cineraria]|uniref:uncharacterized protein LOC129316901 n=1 Tax=Prosopis cineraria TaxID=364024 RepID=UPI00240FF962|nr:uncharacterized protein LOC129316901 [Prosopis cineraria]
MNSPRSPPEKTRGQVLNNAPRGAREAGEVAGGTAAECTAIFCCLPCTVMNVVVLVVYKVPVGLCRKAIHTCKGRPQPRPLKKKDGVLLNERSGPKCRPIYYVETTLEEHLASEAEKEKLNAEFREMDAQMWAPFHGTGFWRSHSQKFQS